MVANVPWDLSPVYPDLPGTPSSIKNAVADPVLGLLQRNKANFSNMDDL